MKVLLVAPFFPPTNVVGAVRLGKFAKYLIGRGYDVRVVAAEYPDVPQTLPLEVPEDRVVRLARGGRFSLRRRLRSLESGVRQGDSPVPRWLYAIYRIYRSVVYLPDRDITWAIRAVRRTEASLGGWRPNVVYASALPASALIVGKSLANRFGVPWVAELRDLWVDSHYYDLPAWRRVIDDRLERRLLGDAAAMVTVSEPLAEVLRQKYGKPTTVVLNGFDPADFPQRTEEPTREASAPITITYTGLVYPGQRDPSRLFEALALMGEERRRFRVRFYGRMLPGLRDMAARFGVEDIVELNGPVPYRQALELQAASDLLLLLLWDNPLEHGVLTGKLFEYLGARRPILCVGAPTGLAACLIRERDAGLATNDPHEIRLYLQAVSADADRGIRRPPLPADIGAGLTRDDQFRLLEERVLLPLRRDAQSPLLEELRTP